MRGTQWLGWPRRTQHLAAESDKEKLRMGGDRSSSRTPLYRNTPPVSATAEQKAAWYAKSGLQKTLGITDEEYDNAKDLDRLGSALRFGTQVPKDLHDLARSRRIKIEGP